MLLTRDATHLSMRKDLCIVLGKYFGLLYDCREVFLWVGHHHYLRNLKENFKKAIRRNENL